MAIQTPVRRESAVQHSVSTPDDRPLDARRRVLSDGPNIMTWVIEPGVSAENSGLDVSRVVGTFQRDKGGDYEAIDEYLTERAGWVDPLMANFCSLQQVTNRSNKATTQAGKIVTCEFCEVAGVPMSITAYRKDWARGEGQEWIGRNIRQQARELRKDGGTDPHLVVWFHPSFNMSNDELPQWLEDCKEVIEGFVDERMESADLEWEEVSSWLSVIHTPWATFATLRKPFNHFNRKYEARVRHLVVDPVVLATAHHYFIQRFVGRVAALHSDSMATEAGDCRQARDDFYRWRSAYWWAQPSKATIPTRVWRGAVTINNTESQVESLTQEMADYAAVEDVRHNQKVEHHNQRLAWGGLLFAILAIALPVVQAEWGIRGTLITGAGVLVAVGAWFGTWLSRRKVNRWSTSGRVAATKSN